MKKTYLYEMLTAHADRIICHRRSGPGYPDSSTAQADLNRLITRDTDRRRFIFLEFEEGQQPQSYVIQLPKGGNK